MEYSYNVPNLPASLINSTNSISFNDSHITLQRNSLIANTSHDEFLSSDFNSFFHLSFKKDDKNIEKDASLSLKKKDIKEKKENENISNKLSQKLVCFKCKLPSKNSKMCYFCKKIFCDSCLILPRNLNVNRCEYCRHIVNRRDYIDLPFIENITKFLELEQNIRNKKTNIEKENEKLREELNVEKCKIHNEKILYYCFNCRDRLCGKCLMFNNKESIKHEKHNVFDYNEVQKTIYKDIISKMENNKKLNDNLNKDKIKLEKKIKENEIKFNQLNEIIKKISKTIKNNFNKKNADIQKQITKIEKIQEKIKKSDEKVTKIFESIKKLEVKNDYLEKMVKKLEKINSPVNEIENNINKIEKIKNNFQLKNYILNFTKTYEKIILNRELYAFFSDPVNIKIKIDQKPNDNNIYINLYEDLNYSKSDDLLFNKNKLVKKYFPILELNNKNYGLFSKIKKDFENNMNNFSFNKKVENNCPSPIFAPMKDATNKNEDKEEILSYINCIDENAKNRNNINVINCKDDEESEEESDDYFFQIKINIDELKKEDNMFSVLLYELKID